MSEEIARPNRAPTCASEFVVTSHEIMTFVERLARVAVRRTPVPLDPRDVAQDVILALVERGRMHSTPEYVECPAAYYTVVVRNHVRRLLQRASRAADQVAAEQVPDELADPSLTPEEIVERRESAQTRLQALSESLRPRDNAALMLLLDASLSTRDVACRLATTVNHVHQIRHRILSTANRLSVRAIGRHRPDSDSTPADAVSAAPPPIHLRPRALWQK